MACACFGGQFVALAELRRGLLYVTTTGLAGRAGIFAVGFLAVAALLGGSGVVSADLAGAFGAGLLGVIFWPLAVHS